MGSAIFRERRAPSGPQSMPYENQYQLNNSDYVPRSRQFHNRDAPWNVTQWIDPVEPYPKMTSIPVLLVMRK